MLSAVPSQSSEKSEERRREVFIHEIHFLEQTFEVFLTNSRNALGFLQEKKIS